MKKHCMVVAAAWMVAWATVWAMRAAPALAQTSTSEKLGVNSALGISPATADFLAEAAAADLFEIRSSQLAEQRGDARTKAFAGRMMADHQKIDAELRALAQSSTISVAIPDQLSDLQKATLDRLMSLKNGDFDRQYLAYQLSAHKDAVSLFRRYAEGGGNPAIKQWAQKIGPLLQQHLQAAQELDGQTQN